MGLFLRLKKTGTPKSSLKILTYLLIMYDKNPAGMTLKFSLFSGLN